MTQEKVSELAGMHRNTISLLERGVNTHQGDSDPELSTVYRLAHALGVPPTMLLPDGDAPVAPVSAEQQSPLAISIVERELRQLIADGDQ